MKARRPLVPWLAALWLACCAVSASASPLVVLAFHDVRPDVRASFATAPDESAVDVTTLTSFFGWMRANGWQPVSLQQVLGARNGGEALPERAVLLTFDDGYASAYTHLFPLLRQFGYPAVVALVSGWIDAPEGDPVRYGEADVPREAFLTWEQAREMAASGLVELASHSHALHRGVVGNPQGNLMPAATTRRWDAATATYESDAAWLGRIEHDLGRSIELIARNTGQRPRSIVWPYGFWNEGTRAVAQRLGLEVGFSLEEGSNEMAAVAATLRRFYVTYDMDVGALAALLLQPDRVAPTQSLQRAMHVDLDYVWDPDPEQVERNLSALVDRVHAVGPRSVFLQAFADPDGDGVADALYFPNRHLPVRADLFSRVAWQLRTRARVQVYAWMPVLSFRLPAGNPLAQRTVQRADAPKPWEPARYHRLSPFDPDVRRLVGEIYDDLGRHASFAGILFHDDATLAEDEDGTAAAVAAYVEAGFSDSLAAIRGDASDRSRWAAHKGRALTAFTRELADHLRHWQPALKTARNLYATTLLDPRSVEWLAQDYEESLAAYDYTVVMAMPYMEQAVLPDAWLAALARRVLAAPQGVQRTVMELQARDWRTKAPVPDDVLAGQFLLLRRMGIRHLAYYPDDFPAGHPSLETARAGVSVRENLAGAGRDTVPLPGDQRPQLPPAREVAP